MNKIFCIGFQKTGTTTIGSALRILGYKVTGPNWSKEPDLPDKVLDLAHEMVAQKDAFQDNPWPLIYKEMDEAYPGSKFILTVRDPRSWINSVVLHFGFADLPMHEWIYGAAHPAGNESVYLKRYNRHNAEVMDYFSERPSDLLVMDFAAGDGWAKLCEFIGKDIPSDEFPHANKARARRMLKGMAIKWVVNSGRFLGRVSPIR